jgi:L-threonylcarbamoyladenylate synthase
VYGLAANALDEKAVLSVFTAKQRPFFDPLIVHVPSLAAAKQYAHLTDSRLLRLAEAFWPGPLTLLFPKKDNIPDLVTSGLPQVAIRVPKHPLTLALLQETQLPLAAPSANPFGYVSPTTAQHVNDQLGKEVQYILDGGPCAVGLESTIVGIEEDVLCLYRLGGLSVEAIEAVVGPIQLRLNVSSDPKAPGQLKNHYAPRKPLLLGDIEALLKANSNQKIALITYDNRAVDGKFAHRFVLSTHAVDSEAALSLFRSLREADQTDADLVIAELVPEQGLGRAINDRLRRAAAH